MQQQGMFDPNAYRISRLEDFAGLGLVRPTALYGLHQGTDVLIYRHVDRAKGITAAQNRLFRTLSRLGDHPDAPGAVTVLACTGLAGKTERQIAIYDHMHNDEKLRLAGEDEIGRYITDWFNARKWNR